MLEVQKSNKSTIVRGKAILYVSYVCDVCETV